MKKSIIVLLLINVISLVVLNIINFFVFNSIITMYLFNGIFVMLIFLNLYLSNKGSIKTRHIIFNIIFLLIVFFTFYFNLPQFSFIQAQNIILKNEQAKELKLQDKLLVNIKMINSPKYFIGKAYLIYTNDREGEKVYIFNPINGEYHLMK
ncbi:hypothetical protein [Candidatus Clostridium stratigraminis]|uniref:DUF4131 domain-containing protein n=1 Tax=Candidatus Clostridium stratigraminis TaxID=3381661 RepID=A0ABW8T7N0_9CLOT